MNLKGKATTITMKTLNGEVTENSKVIEGLEVYNSSDLGQEFVKWLRLPKSYNRKDIPADSNDTIKPDQLSQWKYLDRIKGELFGKADINIALLTGANCVRTLEPEVVIRSKDGGPYAFRTVLGWCGMGPVAGNNKRKISCNRTAVMEAGTRTTASHHL